MGISRLCPLRYGRNYGPRSTPNRGHTKGLLSMVTTPSTVPATPCQEHNPPLPSTPNPWGVPRWFDSILGDASQGCTPGGPRLRPFLPDLTARGTVSCTSGTTAMEPPPQVPPLPRPLPQLGHVPPLQRLLTSASAPSTILSNRTPDTPQRTTPCWRGGRRIPRPHASPAATGGPTSRSPHSLDP